MMQGDPKPLRADSVAPASGWVACLTSEAHFWRDLALFYVGRTPELPSQFPRTYFQGQSRASGLRGAWGLWTLEKWLFPFLVKVSIIRWKKLPCPVGQDGQAPQAS